MDGKSSKKKKKSKKKDKKILSDKVVEKNVSKTSELRSTMDDDEDEDVVMDPQQTEVLESKDKDSSNKRKVTTKYLTKYEKARILGTRALQISNGAPIMVDNCDETDALAIASMELRARTIPMIIRRRLPDGSHEDWSLDELIIY
eukprot:CAMPEP_0175163292 /NCGR_PEP_ID=MMETSP0087-20121206/25666_1 /TAXON_ID=136419 /ORGANISM="Unknown Unknown, Strain D1" /LENGTH=144 /DNA_ID=CAMNT_0016451975 /DNA_START=29 /DNA_END=463 /DNA_ORIENTATION=+